MTRFSPAVPLVLSLAAGVAHAQVTITGQTRYIEGSTSSTNMGQTTNNGPTRIDAPAGNYGTWTDSLNVAGNVAAIGSQDGGYDGAGTFLLQNYTMSISGGGGPDTSGMGTLTNVFGYTFQLTQPATFTLNGMFQSGPSVTATFQFTGPSVSINQGTAGGTVAVTFESVTGTLAPGAYTMKLEGAGTISYVGPGGNGSGAGGTIPLLTLVITPAPSCYANCDQSTIAPVLNINDFICFTNTFAAGNSSANCDASTTPPVLNINDFICFTNRFAAGCS